MSKKVKDSILNLNMEVSIDLNQAKFLSKSILVNCTLLCMYVILSQANGPSGSKAQETCDSLDLGVSDSQFRPDDKWEAITGASFHNTNIFSIHETVVGH